MHLTVTNEQAGEMITLMSPYLERRDLIGYAAAYNTRILMQASQEYIDLHETLLEKYGREQLGPNGEHTNKYLLTPNDPNYEKFLAETSEWGNVKHEVDLVTVPAEKAIGELSGREILSVQWMFDWKEK